jgi:hypothetical protein
MCRGGSIGGRLVGLVVVMGLQELAAWRLVEFVGRDTGGHTITLAANAPLVTALGMSIARLHALVAVSQSSFGIDSRMVCRAFCE